MYLYTRLQKEKCLGCLRGAQLFSLSGGCKAGKSLQKPQVSFPVREADPAATEHPFLRAVLSRQRVCSFSQQGFFVFFQKQQPQPWRGGRERKQHFASLGTGSADRLMSGVHLLRVSSLAFRSGKDDRRTGHVTREPCSGDTKEQTQKRLFGKADLAASHIGAGE